MRFYAVITEFFDSGKVTANMFCNEYEKRPKNVFKSMCDRDIYIDYFASLENAENFLNSSKAVI